MDEKSIADVFRVEDPEIDVAALVARIREGLATHSWADSDLAEILKEFGAEADETSDETTRLVARLGLMVRNPLPSNRLRPAQSARDRFLNRLRAPLHEVIRFYVDAQAERHEEMFRQVHATLAELSRAGVALRTPLRAHVAQLDQARTMGLALVDEATALRAEIDALRAEIVRLRSEVEAFRQNP